MAADLQLIFGTIGVSQMISDLTRLEGKAMSLGSVFTSVTQSLSGPAGIAAGVAIIAGVVTNGVKAFAGFEQSLADLSAITGATGKDLQFYQDQAIKIGSTTTAAASEVVEAYKLIGSAKPELLDNSKALNDVTESALLLAEAAGMQLPEAATALTDALNQFQAPAQQAGAYVDVLAAAAKYGASEIPQTTQALLGFGTVAKQQNVNIYESAAAIEVLAAQGLKGAEAGHQLRNILLKMGMVKVLDKPSLADLARLGVNLDIVSNAALPLVDRLRELSKISGDTAALGHIFDVFNVKSANILLGNVSALEEMTKKVSETGIAASQAATRTATLEAFWKKMQNLLEVQMIGIGESLKPVLDDIIEGFIPALESVKDLFHAWAQPIGELITAVADLGKSLGFISKNTSTFAGVVQILTGALKLTIAPFRLIVTIVAKAISLFTEAREGLKRITTQMPILGTAIKILLGPIGVLNEALGFLGGLFGSSGKAAEDAAARFKHLQNTVAQTVVNMGGGKGDVTAFIKTIDQAQFAGLSQAEALQLLQLKFKIYLEDTKKATQATDDLAKAQATAGEAMKAGPLPGSIDFINAQLKRLREAFTATDSELKRISIGKAIEGYEFQLMKFGATVDKLKGQQADTILDPNFAMPQRTLETLDAVAGSLSVVNAELTTTGKIIEFISRGSSLERAQVAFEQLRDGAKQIGDAFKQFAVDAAFAFGEAIAGSGKFGQSMAQLLTGLGATITKLAGMALLNASISLGPTPAALGMALAGLGLIGLSGAIGAIGRRNQQSTSGPSLATPNSGMNTPSRSGIGEGGRSAFEGVELQLVMQDGTAMPAYIRRAGMREGRRRG